MTHPVRGGCLSSVPLHISVFQAEDSPLPQELRGSNLGPGLGSIQRIAWAASQAPDKDSYSQCGVQIEEKWSWVPTVGRAHGPEC